MAATGECPIDRCDAGRGDRQLMCKKHWRKVPKDLQARVYAAARKMWRAESNEGVTSGQWTEAYQAWDGLRDEAIAAVELKEAG